MDEMTKDVLHQIDKCVVDLNILESMSQMSGIEGIEQIARALSMLLVLVKKNEN